MAGEISRVKILFDKPIYVRQNIFDISKITLFNFQFDFIMNCKLLYTDTDSLTYTFLDHNVYQLIKANAELSFYTSDYPTDNILPSTTLRQQESVASDEGRRLRYIYRVFRLKTIAKSKWEACCKEIKVFSIIFSQEADNLRFVRVLFT